MKLLALLLFWRVSQLCGNYDGEFVVVPANTVDFQPNLDEFEKLITNKTKAVIVNTPNNPSGAVYSEETIIKMSEILEKNRRNMVIYLYNLR